MRATAVSAVVMAIMMVAMLGIPNVAKAQTPAKDTLIIGVHNDTPNLHPWDTATNSVWKAFLWRDWTFEVLFDVDPDGNLFPVLAESYDATDPMNVLVNLRTGLKFTDGTPVTVDDIIFSYQICAFNSQLSSTIMKSVVWPDPPTYDRWNASTTAWGAANPTHVGVVKTLVPNQIKFELRQPYSMFFFGTFAQNPIMPSHIWKDHLVEVNLAGFELPGGVTMSQGTEFDYDSAFGSSPTDIQATIGTGPWYLEQWTPLTSATLRVYDGYWGKAESINWAGRSWPRFPSTLKRMEFRIYGTLDVAILALKSGEVHVVPWNLPSGFYNDLRRDPRMGFQMAPSDGFFYIAFNMRKEPFDDIEFRRAVGYAIDKDFIVDRLLAGFGIRGQVPISPVNQAYVNSSAVTPTFDKTTAESILTAAGYIDADSDGWRDFPDGRPLKFSILTPAKDYDPTRADAGIMIANNLKSIGLNIDSAPTAFDAIVSAVFVAVQFDMYILGWVNLGNYPELYLWDFFGCTADVTGGVGSNTPGFCNAEFEQKLTILDQEMDDAVRIQAAKDAQGILVRELPYNTLYDTQWIEGYRADIWGGWIIVNGEIFNEYSIGVLGEPGAPVVPSGALTISLNMPGQGYAGTSVPVQVYAVQAGLPAGGVEVNITASTGEWANVTTGSNGYAQANFLLPYVSGSVNFIAEATKGTDVGGDIAQMNIVLPNEYAQLSLSTTTPVIAPAGTATITAKVTDRKGNAIQGVSIDIIPELVLGAVDPISAATDSTGTATFTYTAPVASLIPNRNHYDFIKAEVSADDKPKLPEIKTQTLVIGVQNPTSDWYVMDIQSVSAHVIDNDPVSAIPATSTVSVLVAKQDGTPVASEDVTASLSNATAMTVDQATKPTDGSGIASFTFTAQTGTSTPVSVNFTIDRAFRAMSGLSMLVTDSVTPAYATSMNLATKYADPNSAVSMTVTVYNETGVLANGTEVDIYIPYNEVGFPVSQTMTGWTFIGYVGSIFSELTDVSGTVTTTIDMKTFPADNVVTLEVGIGGFGPQGAFLLGSPTSMYFYENVIQKRNRLGAVGTWTISPLPLSSTQLDTTMTLTFYNLGGAAQGMSVSVYRGLGNLGAATWIGDYTTSSTGQITVPWTELVHETDTSMGFTTVIIDTTYALGGQYGSTPFERKYAYLVSALDPTQLFPVGSTSSTIVRLGASQTYDITVKNFAGAPIQDVDVTANIASSSTVKTDGTGRASLTLVPGTSNPTGTDAWEISFTIKNLTETTSIQLGTLVGVGVFAYSNLVLPSSPKVGEAGTISVDVQNTGPVADYEEVMLVVDGTHIASKTVLINAGATVTVSFQWVPSDTDSHTIAISTVSDSLQATGADVGGIDAALAIGLAIVLLIVGIVIGFLIGKRGKPPAVEEAAPMEAPMEEMEAEKPVEEEPMMEEKPPE